MGVVGMRAYTERIGVNMNIYKEMWAFETVLVSNVHCIVREASCTMQD